MYDIGSGPAMRNGSLSTSYIIYHTPIEPQASCLAVMSDSFICGFVVLMEPFPLGDGFLFLGDTA
ncbi:hypothetical protein BH09BAC4_BH09BAC4_40220 [soil metagenome]